MLTLEEEIMKLDLIASDAFEGGNANEFRQLAEWLKELKAYKERMPSYEAGYNDAKKEIALSGEYERAYQRGYDDGYCKALEDSH